MVSNTMVLIGRHLYKDNINKVYYYNRFDSLYYFISDQNIKKYVLYSYRTILSFLLFYFMYVTMHQLVFGLLLAIGAYSVSSFYFYKKFIPTLPSKKSIVAPTRITYRSTISDISKNRLLTVILLSLLLGICFMVNAVMIEDIIAQILNGFLSMCATIFCMYHIYIYTQVFFSR